MRFMPACALWLSVSPVALALAPAAQPGAAPRPHKPNEVGLIPIIMYHSVGEALPGRRPLAYDKRGLNIAPSTFRRQLQLMYEAGWYPMNVRDLFTPRLAVPAGKTPVAITFDDARGSQLRLLPNGAVDPNCAVGILDEFSRTHPDWPRRASFYVLPRSRYNPTPFWQPGKEKQKLAYLVQAGYEIGNHSATHPFLSHMGLDKLRWEVAECIRYVRKLEPRATMDTFCVPYGAMPRTPGGKEALLHGLQGGTAYQNRCLLEAWGGPSYPVTHRKFDASCVTRIGTAPGEVEATIRALTLGRGMHEYVSDGDPNTVTVPSWAQKLVNPARLDGARLVVYPDTPPGAGKKAKASAGKAKASARREGQTARGRARAPGSATGRSR
jgi:peptidoglycan/xylan/chitin deacetylase (PgdA/CDA1 family)